MTRAQERAKKIAKTKRLPKSLQQRERLLDSIDLVQRLNDAAAARRGMAHARNIGIESERLATHASGATHAGLSSIAEADEAQRAADGGGLRGGGARDPEEERLAPDADREHDGGPRDAQPPAVRSARGARHAGRRAARAPAIHS